MQKTKIVKDYVCFDLETTGFGRLAEIIDIGAVKVRDGEIVDTFSELVKPTRSISRSVTALTGISMSDIRDARSIAEVLPDFLDFISEEVLVGHNIASFDIPIIRRNAAIEMKVVFEPEYIDTVYLSKKVSGVPDHKLSTMLDHYGIINERAHRAYEDCEATSKLFNALVAEGIVPEVRHSYSYIDIEAAQPVPVKEDIDVTMGTEILTSVAGLRLVLTGDFESCSRAEAEAILTEKGTKLRNTVTSKTDYLVVGNLGSDMWKYSNGGGKIQQAAQLGVKILPETAISDLLKEIHNV